jgi:hypothetical protein
MLTIVISDEHYDEETSEFVLLNTISLDLEHSLLSLSKWESKFQKPFIDPRAQKSPEEVFGYLQAMVITPGVDLDVLYKLTQDQINEIQNYVDSSQSATTFGKLPDRPRSRRNYYLRAYLLLACYFQSSFRSL